MHPHVLVDYELAVARQGFIVRALLKLEGHAATGGPEVPLNLALVLDRSGSMAGEKLERAREAAAFLVRRLRPTDLVSVVAYDDEVTTVALPATGAEQAALPRQIEAIGLGGCTNLSGGWIRGHELVAGARARTAAGALHRVLLLTDGQANAGITDPVLLVGLCRSAARAGVGTTTIGFGADYDETLLRAMADAGGGNAYYIERPDQAPGVFEEEIEGLLTLAAQNVTVEIRPGEGAQLVAVHNRYPTMAVADGVRVELGDLYAREPKSLLLELFVPGVGDRAAADLASVTVTAHALTAGGGIERQEIRLPIASALDGRGRAEPEVRRELLVMDAARAREDALERHRGGDAEGAARVLRAAAATLAAAPPDADGTVAEQARDLAALAEKLAADTFSAADEKYAAQRAYNVRRGRGLYERKLTREPPGR